MLKRQKDTAKGFVLLPFIYHVCELLLLISE